MKYIQKKVLETFNVQTDLTLSFYPPLADGRSKIAWYEKRACTRPIHDTILSTRTKKVLSPWRGNSDWL